MEWFRALSKLTVIMVSDAIVIADYIPVALQKLNDILGGDDEFVDYEYSDESTTGDSFVDYILGHFIGEVAYNVKDWGVGLNGEMMAERMEQEAFRQISSLSPSKVVFSQRLDKWFSKDAGRGPAMDTLEAEEAVW